MKKRSNSSQSILAYAALIAIITLALIIMFRYVKESVQGKYRDSADIFGNKEQYQLEK